jgi:hypothetical protein
MEAQAICGIFGTVWFSESLKNYAVSRQGNKEIQKETFKNLQIPPCCLS